MRGRPETVRARAAADRRDGGSMTSKHVLRKLLAGGPSAGADGPLRLQYLREVSCLLWPRPVAVSIDGHGTGTGNTDGDTGGDNRPGASGRDFVLVPSAARPRLLVPAHSRRVAAAAVGRYAEPRSRRGRARARLLDLSLASGIGMALMRERVRVRVPPGAETIETYLRDALGRDLSVSMHIGPARANRKPVLQLLSPSGETIGFAKVGVNTLTGDLVRAERDSLAVLRAARLRTARVPAVLHHGVWNGMDILVQSALPVWLPRERLGSSRLTAAMREVAEVEGTPTCALEASPYWTALDDRLAHLHRDDNAHTLRRAAEHVGRQAGRTQLAFGAWHGDWTPWNMATLPDTLLVWDWERFGRGVPLGFDALHYHLQSAVVRGRRDPELAVGDTLRESAALLSPFGAGAEVARLTCLLYLIDLATRYLTDGQAEAGARLGILGSWLLPVLVAEVERL